MSPSVEWSRPWVVDLGDVYDLGFILLELMVVLLYVSSPSLSFVQGGRKIRHCIRKGLRTGEEGKSM